jgi:hypothetical protein
MRTRLLKSVTMTVSCVLFLSSLALAGGPQVLPLAIEGRITRLDAVGKSMVVEGPGSERTGYGKAVVHTSEAAVFRSNSGSSPSSLTPIAASDLRLGETVRAYVSGPAIGDPAAGVRASRIVVLPQNPTSGDTVSDLTWLWGIVEKKDWSDPDVSANANEVVTTYRWTEGLLWGKRKFVAYIVKLKADVVPAFQAAGFKPLTNLRVAERWNRISDINGWGTDVNGEVHRAAKSDLDFTSDNLDSGFVGIKTFLNDPAEVLKESNAELYDSLYTRQQVVIFEWGFVMESTVVVSTNLSGATVGGGQDIKLFESYSRSGYQSLR